MKYIIYARKSTVDEDRQVLSIESQLAELREFAAKEKLEIVASFQEAKTAKEPENIESNHILVKENFSYILGQKFYRISVFYLLVAAQLTYLL